MRGVGGNSPERKNYKNTGESWSEVGGSNAGGVRGRVGSRVESTAIKQA